MKKITLIFLFSLQLFSKDLHLAMEAYRAVNDCQNAHLKGDVKDALALTATCYITSDKSKTIIPKERTGEIDLFQEPPPPIIKNW